MKYMAIIPELGRLSRQIPFKTSLSCVTNNKQKAREVAALGKVEECADSSVLLQPRYYLTSLGLNPLIYKTICTLRSHNEDSHLCILKIFPYQNVHSVLLWGLLINILIIMDVKAHMSCIYCF